MTSNHREARKGVEFFNNRKMQKKHSRIRNCFEMWSGREYDSSLYQIKDIEESLINTE